MIKYVDSGGQVRLVTNIRKPRKWRRFEYLESSGTLYIDTGYVPNNTSGMYLKAYSTTTSSSHIAVGTRLNSSDTRWFINYYKKELRACWNGLNTIAAGILNTWTEVKHNYMNSRGAEYNGVFNDLLYGNLVNITYNAYIFANNSYGAAANFFIGKISEVKLTENNTIVRHFVPAQYNGEYGMWDLVEDKFYPNKGTGTFTVGPEIKNYDEIYEVRNLGPDQANDVYPVSYLYDRTIYEEPDGSKWLRIVHHNNPSANLFSNSDSFTTYVHTNEHLFFDASWCNNFTSWELMVKQKITSSAAELKFRWVLDYNPMTATYANVKRANVTYNTSSDYTTPIAKLGGLYYSGSHSYLICNNGTSGNWYGNVGGWTLYLNGMPGWNNTVVTTGYLDLYIRIA